MQSQTRIFTRLIGEHAIAPPVVLPPGATVAELVEAMSGAKQSSALVVDDAGLPAGIVTEQNILRRVALSCSGDEA